ncbi:CAP domain-containing protein [Euzebya pacifica]|nr:CAP domain-containing protein [Euzebya pacifica]
MGRMIVVGAVMAMVLATIQVGPAVGQDNGAGAFLRVVDEAGTPLEGVQVRWTNGGPLQLFDWTWTDEDGKAFLYDEGDIAVRFEPSGAHGSVMWLGGTAGRSGSTTLSLRNGAWLDEQTVVVPEGGSISGTARLTDGTAVPWTCGLVRTPGGDLVTRGWGDEDGRWATREIVPAGEYVVEFQHCGSTTTWGWHGGDSLATATRVTVAADADTPGIDVSLDPATRPTDELPGRPTSDAEVLAQHELLNRFRQQMGLQTLQLDWTQVEANRLHARYSVATSSQAHDEDRSSPWHTEEGYLGSVTSGLGGPEIVRDLAQAPFHWFNALNPYSRWAGMGGWRGGNRQAGGLHIRPDSPEERPAAADDVDWPIVWPADGSVAAGRTHSGEFPPPAGACGWHDPTAFIEFGFPMMVQMDHHSP